MKKESQQYYNFSKYGIHKEEYRFKGSKFNSGILNSTAEF
jgi:hypothetical protein